MEGESHHSHLKNALTLARHNGEEANAFYIAHFHHCHLTTTAHSLLTHLVRSRSLSL